MPTFMWLLPFIVLVLPSLSGLAPIAPNAVAVLWCGAVVLLILTLLGPVRLRSRDGQSDASRRVALRALLATMTFFAACCAEVAAFGMDGGVLGVWPAIVSFPVWLVCSLFIPLWCGSTAVREDVPSDAGWRCVGGTPLWYAARDERALWVRYPRSLLSAGSVGYTPNLGTVDGQLMLGTLVVLAAAMIAMTLLSAR